MAEQKQSLYLRVQEKLSNVSTVNNYKELCKLLDETDYSKPSQKKHQKKQLENWKKCFTWRKNKDKFINIKVIPPEEYYQAVVKELYQNTAIWIFCSFLNIYGQYTNGENLCISKGDLATAIGLQNENFKHFHSSPYIYGKRLEKYTLDLKDSRYPFATESKKEIRETRKENESALAKHTMSVLEDYDSHTSKQNYYQVESILSQLEKEGVIFLQNTIVGGFIDKDKLPFDADYSAIYEENGSFYLPLKNKEPLLVTYKERPLTSKEIDTYVNLRGQIFIELGCNCFSSLISNGKQKEFEQKMTQGLINRLGAVFAYPSYLIKYSTALVALNESHYKNQTSDFFDELLLRKNLTTNNKESQKKILKLKEERQHTEIIKSRHVIKKQDGTVEFPNKEEEKAVQLSQQYEIFLYEKLNKDLIQLNLDKLIPQNLESLSSNPSEKSSVWENLFNKSWSKIQNSQNP